MTRTGKAEAGFTLLEVMVVLVLLGLLAAGLAQAAHFGFAAWGVQDRLVGERDGIEAVDRTLRDVVRHVALPQDAQEPGLVGSAHALLCVTDLSGPAAGRIGLADAAFGVTQAHRLVLRWTPHWHARLLGPRPPSQEAELLDGVKRLDISYWPNDGTGWVSSWNSVDLPALVRIRLVFTPADRRRWPDIVVALKTERFVNVPGDG